MNTNHTPGPWRARGIMVTDTTDTLGGMARIEMPGANFAFCTNHADARLISAAPELLQACNDLQRELAHWHGWRLSTSETYPGSDGARICLNVLSKARQVIAKATGGDK